MIMVECSDLLRLWRQKSRLYIQEKIMSVNMGEKSLVHMLSEHIDIDKLRVNINIV